MPFREVPARARTVVRGLFQDGEDDRHVPADRDEISYPLNLVNGTYQVLIQEVIAVVPE